MKIAIEGCCHGELEKIYEAISCMEKTESIKIDLVLICGDFQATRNPNDLQCMAVPPKYREMVNFYKYYKGEKKAPILTVMIGGNHEASNHMQELPYGGWLAPNIYYLGYAGIVNFGGIRIGGMSGIYKGKDYHTGHHEYPPYSNDTMRSCYHTRSLEVFRFKQVRSHVDIMLSHDWPVGAVQAGNIEQLLRWKPDFRDEIQTNSLGSPAAQEVLNHVKPTYWFSAHLHCKYPAVIQHKCSKPTDEVKLTKFLALDKCLPRRKFLQIIDIETDTSAPYKLQLDAEWLCILKSTNHLLNLTRNARYMPGVGCNERYDFSVTEEEKSALLEDFGGDLTIPNNFEMTVTPYDGVGDSRKGRQPDCKVNPQTTLLCQMLDITDPFAVFSGKTTTENPDEISLDVDSGAEEDKSQTSADEASQGSENAEQLNLESHENQSDISSADVSQLEASVNQSTSEEYPTFLHSMTANESMLEDSLGPNTAATPIRPTTSHVEEGSNRKRTSQDDMESQTETNEPSASATKAHESADIPSGIKKFKRRNVAMYSILTNQGTGEDNTSND